MTTGQRGEGMDSFIKHAALIWQQDGCTVDQARFKAWCEGPDGYAERLKVEETKRVEGESHE